MTEREKMIEIALNAEIMGMKIRRITGGISMANAIVDALIAAGIGDTTNLIVENEVLQRALLTACVNLIKDKEDNVNMELLARVVYTNYLRQAKKELAEEKNEQV